MAKRQRTSEMDPVREKSYFEQQREALLGDIALVRPTACPPAANYKTANEDKLTHCPEFRTRPRKHQ
ncbi:hypothetical protein MAC_07209 [Metarhizium acridum CQMa 102]|uniref:Uncharacterized protein n=1 Tax=Metarhizium acridum (strain CQMa 102) TaxID=655827 RepID=E9EBG1_METAQ|nr:uncharacterized protein MAC_07209 [Metarhizium acridum CQMa 102]EFY86708.1 hypothetical protein MAC_07209 [Metarhizium acridum CQMa 102]